MGKLVTRRQAISDGLARALGIGGIALGTIGISQPLAIPPPTLQDVVINNSIGTIKAEVDDRLSSFTNALATRGTIWARDKLVPTIINPVESLSYGGAVFNLPIISLSTMA